LLNVKLVDASRNQKVNLITHLKRQRIVTLASLVGGWGPDRLDVGLFSLSGEIPVSRLETDGECVVPLSI
jgi:hypothetical protein